MTRPSPRGCNTSRQHANNSNPGAAKPVCVRFLRSVPLSHYFTNFSKGWVNNTAGRHVNMLQVYTIYTQHCSVLRMPYIVRVPAPLAGFLPFLSYLAALFIGKQLFLVVIFFHRRMGYRYKLFDQLFCFSFTYLVRKCTLRFSAALFLPCFPPSCPSSR